MDEQMWAGVRDRVAALGDAKGAKVFGSLGHKFRFDDALSTDELAALETWIGVRLPEEYRQFLLSVGAGGAGPAYGVYPVVRGDGRWRWVGDGADLADWTRLGEPFPRQGPDQERVEELLNARPDEEDFEDGEGFDDANEAWEEQWGEVMFHPDRTVGAVVISTVGCAARQWLVISGPERGNMWADDRVDDVDLAPMVDAQGAPLTFARWYMDWLTKAEAGISPTQVTSTRPVSG